MKRTEKEQLRESLAESFRNNPNAILMNFAGLKVNDDNALRRKLREAGFSFMVVKNTIARKAAEGTAMEKLLSHFKGTTAIALSPSDPVALAKVFRDFSRDNKSFQYKAILVEGKEYAGTELENVASMPSKEDSLAKLLFLFKYPMTGLARVMQAPLRDLCLVMKETKKEAPPAVAAEA